MVYTLGEAAKATGKSKATISKAIKNGKISAIKGENGAYKIEPSELFRVYELNRENEQKETPQINTNSLFDAKLLEAKLEAAEQRLREKEEHLQDMKEQRDHWRHQATALLTDMRPKPVPSEDTQGSQRFLKWLFR